jgi:hypothetical protein
LACTVINTLFDGKRLPVRIFLLIFFQSTRDANSHVGSGILQTALRPFTKRFHPFGVGVCLGLVKIFSPVRGWDMFGFGKNIFTRSGLGYVWVRYLKIFAPIEV